jgi:acyl dehydratase
MADLSALKVGDRLRDHVQGPITRGTLALYAGASGDHMMMHIDSDFAKAGGAPDVFAHGMLSMAYLAQFLTRIVPQTQLRRWSVRFVSITPVHAVVTAYGEVREVFEEDGERRARLKIGARTDAGATTLDGEAIIAI